MTANGPRPPRLSQRLLEWAGRRLGTPDLAGDAAEIFFDRARHRGVRTARAWYRRQARAAFGRVLRPRLDRDRARRGTAWLSAVSLDSRLAVRMLFKQPGLTVVAVFALAIGIPVGLLPLHVVSSLTRPLPVEEGERIVVIRNFDRAAGPVERSLHDFVRWRRQLSSFEDLGMWRTDLLNVNADEDGGAPVRGAEVTASVFSLLRVQPLLGRTLGPADEAAGAPDVAVIGYDLWQSRLAGDADVVGNTIRIGAVPHIVVGVMPESFLFPVRHGLWLPFRYEPLRYDLGAGPAGSIMGRLAEGVSIKEARTEIELDGRRMATELPDPYARLRPQVLPYTAALTEIDSVEAKAGIALAQGLAFILLTLACGNVGILVLARAATRTGELAVRTALGASRGRILSQLFIESFVLAAVAAALGLVGLQLVATAPDYLVSGLPFWVDFEVSLETALLALSLAVVSAAIAGVVPALKATGMGVHTSMQRASGHGSGIRFGRGYSALVVGEVAAAVWLLALGATLVPALPEQGELGVAADRYLYASIRIPGAERAVRGPSNDSPEVAERVALAHQELVRRLSEAGFGPVAVASAFPGMSHDGRWIQIDGVPPPPGAPAPGHFVNVARVDPGFFASLDQPILSGRDFDAGDLGDDRSAVIVNTSFVDRVLRGRNPLGVRLRHWAPGEADEPWTYEIVGVVGPLGMNPLKPEADEGIYHVVAPGELHPVSIAARVGDDPARLVPRLRATLAEIDPSALIDHAMPLAEVPDPNRRAVMLGTYLVAFLAGIAIVLSAACLYALMSFTVAERTRETGIRAALGARPTNIVAAIARTAAFQLLAGVAIGAALSAAMLARFEGRPVILSTANWPATVGAIGLFMIVVGTLACLRPTLRLVRIRPIDALRG